MIEPALSQISQQSEHKILRLNSLSLDIQNEVKYIERPSNFLTYWSIYILLICIVWIMRIYRLIFLIIIWMHGSSEEKKLLIESMKKLVTYQWDKLVMFLITLNVNEKSLMLSPCKILIKSSLTYETIMNVPSTLLRPTQDLCFIVVRTLLSKSRYKTRSHSTSKYTAIFWSCMSL